MQLIYTDESGISYEKNKTGPLIGFFKDGLFIFYGAICVDENKYFHLERMFADIIKLHFNIDNWRNCEFHGNEMWSLKGKFESYTKDNIRDFFEEIIQLVVKLDIQLVVGCHKKSDTEDKNLQQREQQYAIYSFLHGIEHYLSKKSETGVIIADQKSNPGEKQDPIQLEFSKLFSDRVSWRTNHEYKPESTIQSKFQFETKSCFLLDNIHYVDSRNSLFNQITDIVLFVVMRVWTYDSILHTPSLGQKIAKREEVPINRATFDLFLQRIFNISSLDLIEGDPDVAFDTLITSTIVTYGKRRSPLEFLPRDHFITTYLGKSWY